RFGVLARCREFDLEMSARIEAIEEGLRCGETDPVQERSMHLRYDEVGREERHPVLNRGSHRPIGLEVMLISSMQECQPGARVDEDARDRSSAGRALRAHFGRRLLGELLAARRYGAGRSATKVARR